MSKRAWLYIGLVLSAGLAVVVLGWPEVGTPSPAQVVTFAILTALATAAQLRKTEAPKHQLYYATPVFAFAALILLPTFLFALVVAISYLAEWVKERARRSPNYRNWYLQPFNIAAHILSGIAARSLYFAVPANIQPVPPAFAGMMLAAAAYAFTNHALVGLAVVLARGVRWRDSGAFDRANIQSDLILLLLGSVVAGLWQTNPWFIVPALSPLLLIRQALTVPMLKEEASTDPKTGLANARHFAKLYHAELERAQRFNRPLCFVMSDLDLLRNINNTYGHLAGDVVLAGIGASIRSTVRDYDIASRFGGEEFAIVLPETTLAEGIVIAERLRAVIEATEFPVRSSATPIHATMSFGIAAFPSDAISPNDLLHDADVAVYMAKLNGRNCVVCAADVPENVKQGMAMMPMDRLDGMSRHKFVPRADDMGSGAAHESKAAAEAAGGMHTP